MSYRLGQKIAQPGRAPDEPPVDTILHASGPHGSFNIERDRKGWYICGKRTRISWRAAYSAWGPGAGNVLTVVRLP